MKIVADENMPLVESLFQELGEVVRLPGRSMTADDVKDADILLVRSVTKVNEALLSGSKVKFVGTATIGTDHVDLDWLAAQGIGFANAPGCNAHSVVDYVISALICLCQDENKDITDLTVGVVGAGNVGSRLVHRLRKLGVEVKAYDPFLEDDSLPLTSFEEVIGCDVVSLHVPLTEDTDYPTYHLIDEDVLRRMNRDAILINSARGPVVDNAALKQHLILCTEFKAVLDVWETEPEVERELLDLVDLGTAHIAGYSLDGKYKGTFQIYSQICHFLGLPNRKQLSQMLPEPDLVQVGFAKGSVFEEVFPRLVQVAYDIRRDDRALRRAVLRSANISEAFDLLRKNYPTRREFSSLSVKMRRNDSANSPKFEAAGFKVKVKN
ncbi:4-phosphoerythronate dehydrogenase PdxB [Litoribrevibacter albus]|uniref:Erythronate-4-phosphate dehydrogenase n=1 Tax=Litoribrevibacter albus TaxID=1473156 RepID=A0AA37W699_9GAMM|nr:4-phosphoerythronate dehydrogenase PdxB [Litoribrevibacter albus]GLQ30103.1 erythronate-4-phosphate dehydrogenase [Litoribrevibacter albus]